MFNWSGVQTMPLIRQASAAECGLACIAMISNYHGFKTDLSTLRREFEISLKGARLSDLVAISNKLGFGARGLRCEPKDLKSIRTPAILHWDLSHFVVLKKAWGNKVEIYDPDQGATTYTLEQLDSRFTGVALEVTPNSDFKKGEARNTISMSSLLQFDKASYKPIVQGLLLSAFLQVFVVLAPFFIQLVIDEAILKGDGGFLVAIAVGFAFLKIFELLTNIFRRLVFQLLSKVIGFDLRASIYHHLIRLPLSYFNGRSTGDVQQRFNSARRVSDFVVDGLLEALVDGVLALIIGAILFAYNFTLGLVTTAFVLFYLAMRLAFLQFSRRLEAHQQVASANEADKFLETLKAIQTVKVAGIEMQREGIWRNLAADTVNADIRVGNIKIGFDSLNEGVIGLSLITVVYFAAQSAIDGVLTIGAITAFLAYKDQFERRLIGLFDKWIGYKLLTVHLERVADIALTEQEENMSSPAVAKNFEGGLTFKNVRFRYAPLEPDVLKDIDLDIEPGEFVALAGPSGHGKSTILRLILGLYRQTDGEILYDGLPLNAWGATHMRQQIGVVMQDDTLLAGSIEENISLFDPAPDKDMIMFSAHVAGILPEIQQMPMGLNTLVGDMGSTLSGGQKQRLMIARALYRKPKLLILDEGTSQLDVATEMRINEALRSLKITRIAAAHRPDTMKKADRVLTVQGGLIYDGIVDGNQSHLIPLN